MNTCRLLIFEGRVWGISKDKGLFRPFIVGGVDKFNKLLL